MEVFKKVNIVISLLRENGITWLMLVVLEKFFGNKATKNRLDYEKKNALPGFNTKRYNKIGWNKYDWSRGGEEWNDSEAWKNSVVTHIMNKYIHPEGTVVEIGPGAGKWSSHLVKLSRQLILVDLSERVINLCTEKFRHLPNVSFHLNDGQSLPFISSNSIDYVWAFDVFVHIAPNETDKYLSEVNRILKSGGVAIIHHPNNGGHLGGFRSAVTTSYFNSRLQSYNLKTVDQFSVWGGDQKFDVNAYDDKITIFSKP
jgi:ubiquinone/menaquinone biosynthesis C-methylase UbiE